MNKKHVVCAGLLVALLSGGAAEAGSVTRTVSFNGSAGYMAKQLVSDASYASNWSGIEAVPLCVLVLSNTSAATQIVEKVSPVTKCSGNTNDACLNNFLHVRATVDAPAVKEPNTTVTLAPNESMIASWPATNVVTPPPAEGYSEGLAFKKGQLDPKIGICTGTIKVKDSSTSNGYLTASGYVRSSIASKFKGQMRGLLLWGSQVNSSTLCEKDCYLLLNSEDGAAKTYCKHACYSGTSGFMTSDGLRSLCCQGCLQNSIGTAGKLRVTGGVMVNGLCHGVAVNIDDSKYSTLYDEACSNDCKVGPDAAPPLVAAPALQLSNGEKRYGTVKQLAIGPDVCGRNSPVSCLDHQPDDFYGITPLNVPFTVNGGRPF